MMPAQKREEIEHGSTSTSRRDRGYQTRNGRALAARLTNNVARGIASDDPAQDAAALRAELERLAYAYREFSEPEALEMYKRSQGPVPRKPEHCRTWCAEMRIVVDVVRTALEEHRAKRPVYKAECKRINELAEQIAAERDRHFREIPRPRSRATRHDCPLCHWFDHVVDPDRIPSVDAHAEWITAAEQTLQTLSAERTRQAEEREKRLQDSAERHAAKLAEEKENHFRMLRSHVLDFLKCPQLFLFFDARDLHEYSATLLTADRLSTAEHAELLLKIDQCEADMRREQQWYDRETDFGWLADMRHESNKEFEGRMLGLQYGSRGGVQDRDFRSLWRKQAGAVG